MPDIRPFQEKVESSCVPRKCLYAGVRVAVKSANLKLRRKRFVSAPAEKLVTNSSPNLGRFKAFLHIAKCGKAMRTKGSRLLTSQLTRQRSRRRVLRAEKGTLLMGWSAAFTQPAAGV